jgi:antitoxin (DNA-binding transcriptional repressor) of toxin-antitoxin stability system
VNAAQQGEEATITSSEEPIAQLAALHTSQIKRPLGFHSITFTSDLTEQMAQDTVADFYQGDNIE